MTVLHIETPYFESQALSRHAGRAIWLKMEALQPPGSFKIRGVGLACQTHVQRGAKRFVSSSGGNAGIAVAYAGRQLGVPVTVVVPQTTTERAKALIRQEGAEVIVHGPSWQEANALAVSMLTPSDAFIHPFDDPLLWQGHASLVDEMVTQGAKPEAIVLSVGGGGLLSGVLEGLHRNGWADVPVVALETDGADSFAQSVAAGSRVTLPAITSIATSLGARQVCQQAWDWTARHTIHPVMVTDSEALAACVAFVSDQRVVVEPACGAALAAVYGRLPVLAPFKTVAVIACGGVTASLDQMQQWAGAAKG
jgi:L-serine/L-threonine ammonia-lyase